MSAGATADVAILGGGLAGLTLAIQLKQRDPAIAVTVLERRKIYDHFNREETVGAVVAAAIARVRCSVQAAAVSPREPVYPID